MVKIEHKFSFNSLFFDLILIVSSFIDKPLNVIFDVDKHLNAFLCI